MSLSSIDTEGLKKNKSRARALLAERDAQIAALQKQVTALGNQLATKAGKRRHHPLAPNLVKVHHDGQSGSRRQILQLRERLGRNGSIATRQALKNIPDEDAPHPLAQRIINMFKDPSGHMDYLNSEQFAKDLVKLNHKVKLILENEPRVAFLQSPCYVFGDIHGNLEDLHFFSDNIWRLGMSLTAGNFVFLGDYVDRGMSCLECVSYLLAMKLLMPQKVFLLRGNHETRDVNGWEEHYGERSFIYQCRTRFGDELGYRIWEQTNQVFDRMPLAAVIDQDIFCVHGGIPRPIDMRGSRIQDILRVPKVAGINPPYEHEEDAYQQVASDCIWSDPASAEQEQNSVDPASGYGQSLRGGGAICFGNKAVTDFLTQQGFSYIMRAHEAHAEGVAVSKGARVFTVFSTSKDHNQGSQAMAGCILVDFEKLHVINRSPAYRNQYVHRRDSVAVASLSDTEIQKRMRLGLVTAASQENNDDSEDDEEWEDLEEESDEEDVQYRLSETRRVSIDLNGTTTDDGVEFEGSSSSNLNCSAAHLNFAASNGMMDTSDLEIVESTSSRLVVDFPNKRLRSKDRMERMDAIASGDEDEFDEDEDVEFETEQDKKHEMC